MELIYAASHGDMDEHTPDWKQKVFSPNMLDYDW